MMKRILVISTICLTFIGCGTKNSPETQSVNTDADFAKDDYEKITAANNDLGFHMLEHVDDADNVLVSPTSLLMASSIMYNGADGKTKDEIAGALELEDIDQDEMNQANASLIEMLDKDTDDISMKLANSIWVSDDFRLKDAYKDVNKDYMDADVSTMDVADDASADKINDWVEEATNDKITDIVEAPLNQDTVAMLLNAVYFDGNWTYPFDPDDTTKESFHDRDGDTSDVNMMQLHEDELAYMENDTFQAVSLPYGDEEMSMNIFLPKDDNEVDDITDELTFDTWYEWMDEFKKEEGTLQLPRFEFDYETALNDTMQNLGIETAFTKDAEFPKMIQEDVPVQISKMKQKTYLKVDEKGTEAAGATSSEMETTSAPVDEPFSMTVDKPFFITITDDETEAILFMGTINNPEE